MNRKILATLIGQLYRAEAGGGEGGGAGGEGGAGGGGDTPPAVTAADARTALADYVPDPEILKTMPDDKVVEYHGKVTKAQAKAFEGETAKQAAARIEAAKSLKLEIPEGSKLVQEDIDRISAIAREKGLSKAEAEVLVKEANATAAAYETRMQESAKTQRAQWVTTAKSDPEIGGDKWVATEKNAMRAIDTFMPNTKGADGKDVVHPLRAMLRETGFGDHPEVIRLLNKIGASMAEDGGITQGGGGQGAGKVDAATKLYGSSPS